MKSTKIAAIIITVAIIALIVACVMTFTVDKINAETLDNVAQFNHAIIFLHNGEMIEGEVENWGMVSDDVIQVVIDGVTYRTAYSNVILMDIGE